MVSKEGGYELLMISTEHNFRYSKPGAAPLAAWLGHEVIGLHKAGFGFLLGQSVFTSTKVSHVPLQVSS